MVKLKPNRKRTLFGQESPYLGSIILILLGISSLLLISLPAQNQPKEPDRSVASGTWDIQELNIGNLSLTGLTLVWKPPEMDLGITNYRIYQDNTLLAEVPQKNHMYEVKGLAASSWHQYIIEACGQDGVCGNRTLAAASTLSLQEATESLIDEVNDMIAKGMLSQKQGNDLLT